MTDTEVLDRMQSMNLDNDPELFTALCNHDFTEDYIVYTSMHSLCIAFVLSKCNYNISLYDSIKNAIDFKRLESYLIANCDLEQLSDGRVVDFS